MASRVAITEAIRRLRGTWRSDRKKTMSRWVFPKRLADEKRRFWASIFGKNVWRFTTENVYGTFEDQRSVSRYKVLWADQWSAVVLFRDGKEQRVHHIFFDGDWFYLLAGRDNVEYFKRATPNRGFESGRAKEPRAAQRGR